mmetsp:Transcript_19654/g.21953  ORF Transcript_19654/g.21953 Transcript_19654/m.21953 type:complete len:86 (-) Transcript_19654:122-379(-)
MRNFSSSHHKNLNISEDSGENQELNCAEAYPINTIVPEDLVRDIVSKKRMNKLKEMDNKPGMTLDGVFPEIVFDFFVEEKSITYL